MASAQATDSQDEAKRALFLVVDDNSDIREAVAELLSSAFPGCTVRSAESGEGAVKLAESERVTAVILDIGLPGISGIETARRIKVVAPDVPIIMLSIHEEDEYIRDSMSAGASGYVVKRRMARDLLNALRAALLEAKMLPAASVAAARLGADGQDEVQHSHPNCTCRVAADCRRCCGSDGREDDHAAW